MSTSTLPASFPTISSVTIPSSPLIDATVQFLHSHSTPGIFNHVIRTTYLALLACKTQSQHFPSASPQLVLLASLMHDLGWDPTNELVSPDKRFEVDGANAAVAFLTSHQRQQDAAANDLSEENLSRIWHAIALHCTPSIYEHAPTSEVRVLGWATGADFYGPSAGSWLPHDFWKQLLEAFPRAGLREDFKGTMCRLCREKPETTRDNFVAEFGEWLVEGYERGEGRARTLDAMLAGEEVE